MPSELFYIEYLQEVITLLSLVIPYLGLRILPNNYVKFPKSKFTETLNVRLISANVNGERIDIHPYHFGRLFLSYRRMKIAADSEIRLIFLYS